MNNSQFIKDLIMSIATVTGRSQGYVWNIFRNCADANNTVDMEFFEQVVGLPAGAISDRMRWMTLLNDVAAAAQDEPIDIGDLIRERLLERADAERLERIRVFAESEVNKAPDSWAAGVFLEVVEEHIEIMASL